MVIIAVTGGKGGTGKSTVAVALANELSLELPVAIIDADVECPNIHLILDINTKESKKIVQRIPFFNFDSCLKCGSCAKVCQKKAIIKLKDNIPELLSEMCNGCGACKIICNNKAISWKEKEIGCRKKGRKGNITLLTGELKINEPVSEIIVNKLNEEIIKLKEKNMNIITDTAAGTNCPVISALKKAEKIIAVAEPTPLGSHDLELILRLCKIIRKEVAIVINRTDLGDKEIIKKVAEKYNTDIKLEIPFSKEIIDSSILKKKIMIEGIKRIIENK
jgi:MinD superfamily P-loop ATPase